MREHVRVTLRQHGAVLLCQEGGYRHHLPSRAGCDLTRGEEERVGAKPFEVSRCDVICQASTPCLLSLYASELADGGVVGVFSRIGHGLDTGCRSPTCAILGDRVRHVLFQEEPRADERWGKSPPSPDFVTQAERPAGRGC